MTSIGSQWVCSNKVKPDGTPDQYKARLVTQVFKQDYGINYEETLLVVAKMTTVRTALLL